jgi:hypothetical protein
MCTPHESEIRDIPTSAESAASYATPAFRAGILIAEEHSMARTSAAARSLTDHEEIRRWAEDRGARPARVSGTGSGDDVGMIRLDFPGYSGEGSLEEISWDEWFDKFDESNLALMVQDETSGGQKSNFNKLVSGDTAQRRQARTRGASRSHASTSNGRGSRAQGRSRRGERATSGTGASGATRSARATSSRSSRSSRPSTRSSSRRSYGNVRGKKSSARSAQSSARKSSRSVRGRESRRAA